MDPTAEQPSLGVFVRDQVEALRRLDADVEVFAFEPGSPEAYARAAAAWLRRPEQYDIVHAHFGLTAWPALAARGRRRVVTLHGNDVTNPRSRAITRAALPRYDLVAAVSEELPAGRLPRTTFPCCRAASTPTASVRSTGPRGAHGLDWSTTVHTSSSSRCRLAGKAIRPGPGGRRRDAAARAEGSRASRGPAVGQRRQRRVRPVRPRGVRPRGTRGARVRGSGARQPGRHRAQGASRHRRRVLRSLRGGRLATSARAASRAPDPRVQGRARRGVLGGPDGRASAGRLAIAQLSSGQNSDSRLRAPAAGSAISTDSTDGAEMSASSVAPTDRASGRSA